jgi:hypothetical protein
MAKAACNNPAPRASAFANPGNGSCPSGLKKVKLKLHLIRIGGQLLMNLIVIKIEKNDLYG